MSEILLVTIIGSTQAIWCQWNLERCHIVVLMYLGKSVWNGIFHPGGGKMIRLFNIGKNTFSLHIEIFSLGSYMYVVQS